MKTSIFFSGVAAAVVTAVIAFIPVQSAIVGTISPANGAEAVWAISGTDSIRGAIVNTGSFSLTVKPGSYKLIVDARSPYKDFLLPNVEVKDGQPNDVGEIMLQK